MYNETYKRLKRERVIWFAVLIVTLAITVVSSINAVFVIVEILK